MGDGRRGVGTVLVVLRVALILVEVDGAVAVRSHEQHHLCRARLQVLHLRVAGDDGSGPQEVGYLLLGVPVADGLVATHQLVATDVEPLAFGQPCLVVSLAVRLGSRHDGRYQDIVAKHILTLLAVGLVLLGPLVVERAADADTCVVGLPGSGVDIRHQLVAQVAGLQHQGEVTVFPDAALIAPLAGTMGTEDGREDAELQPAQHQFGVRVAYLQVAAQVVTPVAKAYIRGCGGEVRLEGQRAEGAVGVARESDGVAVRAQSAPAVEDERTAVSAVQPHVVIEDVVAPERLAQPLYIIRGEVLLPVYPPEVHSLAFTFTDDMFEHGAVERRVLQHPGYTGGAGIHVHVYTNIVEVILIVGYAVGRVQVERHLQSLVVHPADESFGVRYDALVPCPSCPSVQVPVHVHDHHVDGYVVLLYLVHQVQEVLLRVALILAVPVAQHVEWGHGLSAGYLDIVADSLLVVVAVAHEVPVYGTCVNGLRHPVDAVHLLVEGKRRRAVATLCLGRLVDDGPSAARYDAVLQVGALVVTAASVEGTLRALQVQRVLLARVPGRLQLAHLHGDAQVVGRLQLCGYRATLTVAQRQCFCFYIEVVTLLAGSKLRNGQPAVDNGKRGTVLEFRRRAILNANHLWG